MTQWLRGGGGQLSVLGQRQLYKAKVSSDIEENKWPFRNARNEYNIITRPLIRTGMQMMQFTSTAKACRKYISLIYACSSDLKHEEYARDNHVFTFLARVLWLKARGNGDIFKYILYTEKMLSEYNKMVI